MANPRKITVALTFFITSAALILSTLSLINLGTEAQIILFLVIVYCIIEILLPSDDRGDDASGLDQLSQAMVPEEEDERANPGVLGSLRRQLALAIEREEDNLREVKRRSDSLFRLGRTFLVLSVFGPLAAALLYSQLEPLPPDTFNRIKELQAAGEIALTLAPSRDWRILVAGLSFGFLFLAAAAALLRQRGKETRLLTRVRENIAAYQHLASLVEIRQSQSPTDAQHITELTNSIAEHLLRVERARDLPHSSPHDVHSEGKPFLEQLAKLIEQFK